MTCSAGAAAADSQGCDRIAYLKMEASRNSTRVRVSTLMIRMMIHLKRRANVV